MFICFFNLPIGYNLFILKNFLKLRLKTVILVMVLLTLSIVPAIDVHFRDPWH